MAMPFPWSPPSSTEARDCFVTMSGPAGTSPISEGPFTFREAVARFRSVEDAIFSGQGPAMGARLWLWRRHPEAGRGPSADRVLTYADHRVLYDDRGG